MRIDLRQFVLADPAIAAAVGTRMHPLHLPRKPTYPAITYQQIGGKAEHHLGGRSALRRARMQFDVWARDDTEVWSIAQALAALLDAYKGPCGQYEITYAKLVSERDTYEEGVKAYRITSDYLLTYRENQS